MTTNLERLREVVASVPSKPWAASIRTFAAAHRSVVWTSEDGFRRAHVAETWNSKEDDDSDRDAGVARAAYIATFDPPTMNEMTDELHRLRKVAAAAKKEHTDCELFGVCDLCQAIASLEDPE